MNRELLARTRDRIAAVGDAHCDMDAWHAGRDPMPGSGPPPCGTTACIAGHTLAISFGSFMDRPSELSEHTFDTARDVLGLTTGQAEALFYQPGWPASYRRTYRDEGAAKAMVAVLDGVLDGSLVWGPFGLLIEAVDS